MPLGNEVHPQLVSRTLGNAANFAGRPFAPAVANYANHLLRKTLVGRFRDIADGDFAVRFDVEADMNHAACIFKPPVIAQPVVCPRIETLAGVLAQKEQGIGVLLADDFLDRQTQCQPQWCSRSCILRRPPQASNL